MNKNVTSICTSGGATTCFLIEGNVTCFGQNLYGTFGYTSNLAATSSEPTTWVPLPGKVVKLACGVASEAMCATLEDNSVWCWGQNSNGILGVNSSATYVITPMKMMVPSSSSTCLTRPVEIHPACNVSGAPPLPSSLAPVLTTMNRWHS